MANLLKKVRKHLKIFYRTRKYPQCFCSGINLSWVAMFYIFEVKIPLNYFFPCQLIWSIYNWFLQGPSQGMKVHLPCEKRESRENRELSS